MKRMALGGESHWRTRWLNQVQRDGALLFLVCLISGGMTACVSHGKYEAILKENQALKNENLALRNQPLGIPKEIPQQKVPTIKGDPRKPMNNHKLEQLLSRLVGRLEGREGAWNIVYRDVPMVVLTSPLHDRMRIVSPIRDSQALEPSQMTILLKANFDRALDARYAFFKGNLWSVYLHPLSSLTEAELASALNQVGNLVKTYGRTYSSSHLQFQH